MKLVSYINFDNVSHVPYQTLISSDFIDSHCWTPLFIHSDFVRLIKSKRSRWFLNGTELLIYNTNRHRRKVGNEINPIMLLVQLAQEMPNGNSHELPTDAGQCTTYFSDALGLNGLPMPFISMCIPLFKLNIKTHFHKRKKRKRQKAERNPILIKIKLSKYIGNDRK